MPFAATWMQLEIIILSEVSQKDKYHDMISHMQNLKYDTNEPIYKTERDSQTQRQDLWLPRGMGEGDGQTGNLGWQMQTITFGIYKQQGPTVQHRELYSISSDKSKWEIILKRIYICIKVSNFSIQQILANMVKQLHFN